MLLCKSHLLQQIIVGFIFCMTRTIGRVVAGVLGVIIIRIWRGGDWTSTAIIIVVIVIIRFGGFV